MRGGDRRRARHAVVRPRGGARRGARLDGPAGAPSRRRGAEPERWCERLAAALRRRLHALQRLRPHRGDGQQPAARDRPAGDLRRRRADADRPADRPTTARLRAGPPRAAGAGGRAGRAATSAARGWPAATSGRPELTAERFVPDPFGGRARRRGSTAPATWSAGWPTATLEFLGRVDHQVKIRGFRIELGEIEAALRRASRRCARRWWWRAGRPGEQRLVAYVVRRARPRRPASCASSCAARLPELHGARRPSCRWRRCR